MNDGLCGNVPQRFRRVVDTTLQYTLYLIYIYSSRVGVLSLTKDVYERFRTQLEVKREGNDYIDLLLCL